MKYGYLILNGILLIVLGYIIGNMLPTAYLHPDVTNKEITINDLYTRVISVASTTVTLLAVIAALLKEDIRKFWDFALCKISFKDEGKISEILETELSSSSSNNYKASKYESVLMIKNVGSMAAKNCEIYLEKLQFNNAEYPIPQEIQSSGKPLQWNNNSSTTILIPATGKAYISVFELISPNLLSVPNEQIVANTQAKIKIGETESPDKFFNGTWDARFIIYSENAKPIEFILEIKWSGKWENRLADLSKHISIELKKEGRLR